MSYILDALKKAAEQRSGPAVEVRRLLAPPQMSGRPVVRYVALAVAGAGLLTAAVAFWVWVPASEYTAPPATPVASTVGSSAGPNAPAPAARQERGPGGGGDKARPSTGPVDAADAPPRATAEPRRVVAKPRVAETKPSRAATPAASNAGPMPGTTAAPPPAPALAAAPATSTPAAQGERGKPKVEVIVYSDQPAQRWAFINGRKYVEGDAIGDRGRVEEIQAAGVVIIEDGRRVTLRP